MLVLEVILSEHSHKMVKQMSAVMVFGFRWISSHLRKFMMEIRNLLGGRPSPATRWDSKQTTVELCTIGMSTSGMKDYNTPPSQSTV
jgi:hypothetical protein